MVILTNNYAYSDTGVQIHKTGTDIYGRAITLLSGDTASDFEEVTEVSIYTKAEYDSKVAELVRERYSESEEFAIQRKALAALSASEGTDAEFAAYNSYVNECKVRATDLLTRRPTEV